MPRLVHPRNLVRLLAVLAAVLLTAGIAAGTAAAKQPSCSKQVVNDWYENGRVDKIYPLACYRDAIKSLPVDVIDYSNAKEEIGRALAYAKQGKPDPGPKPTTSTTSTGTTSTGTTSTDAATTATEATVDTSGPSSVPIPLIVLGGLAVLLLAAGSAGYLARRAKAGKGDDDGTPPASA